MTAAGRAGAGRPGSGPGHPRTAGAVLMVGVVVLIVVLAVLSTW